MVQSYRELLEGEGEALGGTHVSMILHRVSTLTALTRQEVWMLQEHRAFVEELLILVRGS